MEVVLPHVFISEAFVVIVHLQVCIDHPDGQRVRVFAVVSIKRVIPLAYVVPALVLATALSEGFVQLVDEYIGMQQWVSQQRGIFQGVLGVIDELWIAVVRVEVGTVKPAQNIEPLAAHFQGLAYFHNEDPPVFVPRICHHHRVAISQAWGREDFGFVAELPFALKGVTVSLVGWLPLGPVGPVVLSVEVAAAPFGGSGVQRGVQELLDDIAFFVVG